MEKFNLPEPHFNRQFPILRKVEKEIDRLVIFDGDWLDLNNDPFFKCAPNEEILFDLVLGDSKYDNA